MGANSLTERETICSRLPAEYVSHAIAEEASGMAAFRGRESAPDDARWEDSERCDSSLRGQAGNLRLWHPNQEVCQTTQRRPDGEKPPNRTMR
jgi:hypothetical protein